MNIYGCPRFKIAQTCQQNIIKTMKFFLLALLVTLVCSQVVVTNFGCRNLSSDGVSCNQCSVRYWKDDQGICQPVSPSCKTYNSANGACTSCYSGFLLLEVVCIEEPNPRDPNCANTTNGTCVTCSRGFYLLKGVCEIINPLCKIWNETKQECSQCYPGYALDSNKSCRASSAAVMRGCSQFNGSTCIKCAPDYYMSQGTCIWTDPSCKTFNRTNGACLTCFPGYSVVNTTCLLSTVSDGNCKTFKDGACTECSKNFYFNDQGKCIQIDPFCKAFDIPSKTCLECYSGFILVSGICDFSQNSQAFDVGCNNFDTNGICTNCSQGYYFNSNNVCVQVDPSCKTFNLQSKVCAQCYPGYTLDLGQCLKETVIELTQKNCAEELMGVCVKCAERAYFDIDMTCVMASDLCKTFNTFNGFCTSCYIGYALNDTSGLCLPSDSAVCSKKDSNNVCTQCLKGYFLDEQKQCQAIDVNCQTFNFSSRICQNCYKGYKVAQNQRLCELAPVIISANVQNCVTYDSSGQQCTQCYNRFYLKDNQCIEANALCKTFDNTGACLTCYSTFKIQGAVCVQA